MALTKEKETEMYTKTIVSSESIEWIRKWLEKADGRLDDCQERLRILEGEHLMLKGRLGAFILGLTFIVSLLVNSVLWVWSHVGGKS